MTPESLRRRRLTAGITQADLASMADVPQPHISAMESGKRTIGPTVAARLDDALDDGESRRERERESMRQCVRRVMERKHLQEHRAKYANIDL